MDKHPPPQMDGGGVNLSIVITPMLDMAFQLMAFFIMTYHPSALEGHIDGILLPPPLAVKGPIKPLEGEDPLVGLEPDLGEVLGVQIKAVARGREEKDRQEGEPQQLLLKLPQEAEIKEIANATVTFEVGLLRLERELKHYLGNQALGKTNIKLEGDSQLKHMYTMMVYDTCKAAGFQDISFVAPTPQRGSKR